MIDAAAGAADGPASAHGSDSGALRVLIASSIYPPQIGGPAIQSQIFARELVRRGAEVRVLTLGQRPASPDGWVEYLGRAGDGGLLARARRHLSNARRIYRLFRAFRPHVVQMQTAGGVLPLIVGISARLHRVPSWVKFAGDPLIEAQNRRKFVDADRKRRDWKGTARDLIIKAVARLVFRTYNYVWTTTPTVADTLACRWGVTRDRIVVDPNLLDLRDLTNVNKSRISNPELLRLLVVTRLHPVKGVDVAIRALARLPDKRAVLRIIGEGKEPYVGQLRSLANELGVADRIEWAGKVPRERLPDDYRQADLLLVPSRYEAFGIVLIEAMAAGLPIVASNVGGIPHVTCEGKCAKLVEPECPEAFAAAIAALANDPREAERLRREGAKRAFDFDAECGVARWLGLYRQLSSAEAWPRERCAARSGRGFDA